MAQDVQRGLVRHDKERRMKPFDDNLNRSLRVLKVGDRSQRISKSRPLTGGTGAKQASAVQLDNAVNKVKWAAGA